MKLLKNKKGFGLVEISIAIVLIVLLIGVSIPKFMSLLNQSKEAQTKYNLIRLRSAIAAYYGEHKSTYPGADIVEAIVPKYIEEVPIAVSGKIGPAREIYTTATIHSREHKGGWYYVDDMHAPDFGTIRANLPGKTLKGEEWDKI